MRNVEDAGDIPHDLACVSASDGFLALMRRGELG